MSLRMVYAERDLTPLMEDLRNGEQIATAPFGTAIEVIDHAGEKSEHDDSEYVIFHQMENGDVKIVIPDSGFVGTFPMREISINEFGEYEFRVSSNAIVVTRRRIAINVNVRVTRHGVDIGGNIT